MFLTTAATFARRSCRRLVGQTAAFPTILFNKHVRHSSNMPTLKLVYFNGKGRMEPLRWILEAGALPYETEFIQFDQWPAKKTTTPYSSMPILYVDGKALCETLSIARYLGNITGMVTSDQWDSATGDEVADVMASLVTSFIETMLHSKDADEKKTKMNTLLVENMPKKFAIWEPRVKGKFLHGDKPTWQDIYMAHWMNRYIEAKPDLLKDFPKLNSVVQNVLALENIKKYLAKPCTYNIDL